MGVVYSDPHSRIPLILLDFSKRRLRDCLTYQFRLKIVLDKVDQEMHDGLGNAVLDTFANDVEIGFYQSL